MRESLVVSVSFEASVDSAHTAKNLYLAMEKSWRAFEDYMKNECGDEGASMNHQTIELNGMILDNPEDDE